MSVRYEFDPEAGAEYHEAIYYYAAEAEDVEVAVRFVAAVESAGASICAAPGRWRIVESPGLRRYVLRRFPFVLYYHHQTAENLVTIYAVMHTSRRPGYWRERLPFSS